MMNPDKPDKVQSGRYSPLRYPGGKGKIARFMRDIIRLNGLSDGRYVEPYAGGAAVAWELLITGIVRRVTINDINRPVWAFWDSVLNQTDALCALIQDHPVTVDEWDRWKDIYRNQDDAGTLELGFAFFFLNRTNRSGILNGGIIGGRKQTGTWKIDARFNKDELILRIQKIAALRSRIELTCMDAVELLKKKSEEWRSNTLIYIDPPYYKKGPSLYHNAYGEDDHAQIASAVTSLNEHNWIVSYDDVYPIHQLYENCPWMQYTLNYSARKAERGREAMFFSHGLQVPDVPKPLIELDREICSAPRAVAKRNVAA
ncbi:DNA adenine methylase [Thalassospira sp. HJ]|uniref:DNA adenine methylase n=1 Tax=Thalassospira sp. HJ TaxID=1616823 RepID=UPI001F243E22|nr:DNA adenine methylase [Thalassospira sp. HJ]